MMASLEPESAPPIACIRAFSERQAMDWSLVLASQGIEAMIERHPETGAWWLAVTPDEHGRAMEAIRQFRLENRGWGWRRELVWPGVFFHWGALLWCWLLILIHWLAEALGTRLEDLGAMSSVAVARGEWWRTVTAVGLHADVGHLAANAATGLVVFGFAMARFGAGWAMLGGLAAGVAGNVAGAFLHAKPFVGLGASGMVMGGLGMLSAQSAFLLWQSPKALRQIAGGLGTGFLLFILVGMNPASDVIAHAGGFLAGVVIGGLLALLPESALQSRRWAAWTGPAAMILFASAWACALLAGHPVSWPGPVPIGK